VENKIIVNWDPEGEIEVGFDLPFFPGFYETHIGHLFDFEDSEEQLLEENGASKDDIEAVKSADDDGFDGKGFQNKLGEICVKEFFQQVRTKPSPLTEAMVGEPRFDHINSPREYNYRTDWVRVNVTFKAQALWTALRNMAEDPQFVDYCMDDRRNGGFYMTQSPFAESPHGVRAELEVLRNAKQGDEVCLSPYDHTCYVEMGFRFLAHKVLGSERESLDPRKAGCFLAYTGEPHGLNYAYYEACSDWSNGNGGRTEFEDSRWIDLLREKLDTPDYVPGAIAFQYRNAGTDWILDLNWQPGDHYEESLIAYREHILDKIKETFEDGSEGEFDSNADVRAYTIEGNFLGQVHRINAQYAYTRRYNEVTSEMVLNGPLSLRLLNSSTLVEILDYIKTHNDCKHTD
jgi:hypothetical protein